MIENENKYTNKNGEDRQAEDPQDKVEHSVKEDTKGDPNKGTEEAKKDAREETDTGNSDTKADSQCVDAQKSDEVVTIPCIGGAV